MTKFIENKQGYKVSDRQVLSSAAGWYIGRTYYDDDMQCELPWSRESDYMASANDAQDYLSKMQNLFGRGDL